MHEVAITLYNNNRMRIQVHFDGGKDSELIAEIEDILFELAEETGLTPQEMLEEEEAIVDHICRIGLNKYCI